MTRQQIAEAKLLIKSINYERRRTVSARVHDPRMMMRLVRAWQRSASATEATAKLRTDAVTIRYSAAEVVRAGLRLKSFVHECN